MDTMTDAPRKKAWMAVADHIARDVRSGLFAPGMWLKQIDLEQLSKDLDGIPASLELDTSSSEDENAEPI